MITGRAQRMLAEDDPELPVWDQDEAAVRGRYAEQDPALVDDELADAADAAGAPFAGRDPTQWSRSGHRSDGTAFTVETLAQYLVHEVEHHLHDVAPDRRPARPAAGRTCPHAAAVVPHRHRAIPAERPRARR